MNFFKGYKSGYSQSYKEIRHRIMGLKHNSIDFCFYQMEQVARLTPEDNFQSYIKYYLKLSLNPSVNC